MKVNLIKNINSSSCLENLEFFKQFNIYETISFNNFIYRKQFFRNRYFIVKHRLKICKVEPTTPNLKIKFIKLINTLEGTSLEGQHLTGKKLIVIGEIMFRIIIFYYYFNNNFKYSIKNINIPFSNFIIIPKDICKLDTVNLRYEIEDISIVSLGENKIMINITPLIQYTDEYLDR